MKKYHLDVVIGTAHWPNHYEVKADTYDYSGSGCYTFYIRDDRDNLEVVASYPISRTIIRRIEEL
jgi:hypothetical protein